MSVEVRIAPDGTTRLIYSDEFMPAMEALGTVRIARASHVEPRLNIAAGGWIADMSPVGGPELGPFTLRQEALDAEVEWLVQHGLPTPKEA